MAHQTYQFEEAHDYELCMAMFFSFLTVNLERYYKIPKHEVHLINLFVDELYLKHDDRKFLASWWKEEKRFFRNENVSYYNINF